MKAKRLDPNQPAPALDGGDWGTVEGWRVSHVLPTRRKDRAERWCYVIADGTGDVWSSPFRYHSATSARAAGERDAEGCNLIDARLDAIRRA